MRFESATSSASTWAKMMFRTCSGSGMFSNTESPVSPADSMMTTPLLSIRAIRFWGKLTLLTRLSGIDTPRRWKNPLWYATRWSVIANRVVCHWANWMIVFDHHTMTASSTIHTRNVPSQPTQTTQSQINNSTPTPARTSFQKNHQCGWEYKTIVSPGISWSFGPAMDAA